MNGIFKRVSVRRYQDRPVEPEKAELLLRAAMAAPSAKNQQPWEFYVVTRRETLESLAACSPFAGCAKNAPMAIVLCFQTEGLLHPAYAQIDLSAATENLLLEAADLDLGAVWLGIAPLRERMDAVRQALSLPDTLEAFAIVPVGYPEKPPVQTDRYQAERVHRVE